MQKQSESRRIVPGTFADPRVLAADVRTACKRIHVLAKEAGWSIAKLAEKAGRPYQSFNNWKQGHSLPSIAYLQDFASAVDANVRVFVQDAQQPTSTGVPGMYSAEAQTVARLVDQLDEAGRKIAVQRALLFVSQYLVTGQPPSP